MRIPWATVWDTETTGLIKNRSIANDLQPEIIEFCALAVNLATGEILCEYYTKLKPRKYPMSDDVLKVSKVKLTNDMLKDAPSYEQMRKKIVMCLEQWPMVIAHNLSFDMEMIEIENERICVAPMRWPRKVCTVEATVHLKGYRMGLSDLYAYLFKGEKFPDAHRAQADTRALARVATELYRRELI